MADRSILIQGLIELQLAGKGGDEAVASMKKIMAQASQVEKELGGIGGQAGKAASEVGGLEKAFSSLGRTVAGYFAAGAVANFLKDSFLGFAQTERQALAVENQIKALGQAAQGAGFRSFIAQLAESSGIIDDELVPAFQRALSSFKNYASAQDVVTLASKFAAAGQGDVLTNVEKLSQFYQTGMARSLTSFGVNVKAGENATLSLVEGFKLLREQAGLLPEKFDDAQASINRWKNELDTARDSIGKFLAAGVSLIERMGTKVGETVSNVLHPENIQKEAEGQRILDELAANADKQRKVAKSALDQQAADEQTRRDREAADQKVKDAAEAEQKIITQRADMERKASEDLLTANANFYKKGSQERIDIELRLNQMLEADAIASAEKIGASTEAIYALFARRRADIIASQGEGSAAAKAREEAAQFDPRAGFDEVEKWAAEHEKAMEDIAQAGAVARNEIAADSLREQEDIAQRQAMNAIQSAQTIATSLGMIFAKHKSFAIATAIINTALGVTSALKDESIQPWWAKLAAISFVIATGAAQIAAIRGSSPGGGGGQSGIAAAPTSQASPPPGVNASQSVIAAVSGRAPSGGGGTVINIGTAFGDRQSMTKLARELDRINRNNQSVLR